MSELRRNTGWSKRIVAEAANLLQDKYHQQSWAGFPTWSVAEILAQLTSIAEDIHQKEMQGRVYQLAWRKEKARIKAQISYPR
ncbi:hypothetical protein M0R72_07555 [Candidatus Pacearchaeota archaeon]|jgi:hypothetical protein|nr:hypothetical protein [Candidatus Pacearchaeota archaeon]